MNGKILNDAIGIINGDRQQDYGDVHITIRRIADLWGYYLGHDVSGIDVCMMMTLLKIARQMHKHKLDNLVDAAGYIGLAGDMAGDK